MQDSVWLSGSIIEEAREEWHKVTALLTEYHHLTETYPVTGQVLLASCIIPSQAIRIIACQHPETIRMLQKKTATTHSLVTDADHLAQILADSLIVDHLQKRHALDKVFFNTEEATTTEYQQFFFRKEYQAWFKLSPHIRKLLNNLYQRKTRPEQCTYLSNLDPLDGTACFSKWIQSRQTEDARWTVAHTLSEITSEGRIKPVATAIHNPVLHKTYFLDRSSGIFVVIDSHQNKILPLADNQNQVDRLIVSSRPQDSILQSMDNRVIHELTRHQTMVHGYREAGHIFDTCEVVDPDSPVTSTYSLAVGGLHDLHIPLWDLSTSANLLCPQLKPLAIKPDTLRKLQEYAFAFGPARDLSLFRQPRIQRVLRDQLRPWHDDRRQEIEDWVNSAEL